MLLLSNPGRLLASLALYSWLSYRSGSSALVASGVFGLEAVSRLHMLLLCSQARLSLSPRLASLCIFPLFPVSTVCPLSGVDCFLLTTLCGTLSKSFATLRLRLAASTPQPPTSPPPPASLAHQLADNVLEAGTTSACPHQGCGWLA